MSAWKFATPTAVLTGTDTRAVWSMVVYGASVAAVVALLAVRFGGVPLRVGSPPRLRPYALTGLILALLLGSALTAAGPLERGWAARTGAVPAPTAVITVRATFRDKLSGIAQPYNEYTLDPGYKMLTVNIDGTGQYPISLSYRLLVKETRAGIRFIRDLFSMAPRSLAWSCSGTIAVHPPDRLTSLCKPTGAVRGAHFFEQPAQTPPAPGAVDYRQYTITIQDRERAHTVQVVEPIEDPNPRRLEERLRATARA